MTAGITRRSLAAALLVGTAITLAGAAGAADLAEIKERGQLIAATSGNLPPVTFLNASNELEGYDINVAHYIEDKIGVPIELVRLDWKGILPGLQTGRFDAVFSNVNITDERKITSDPEGIGAAQDPSRSAENFPLGYTRPRTIILRLSASFM